MKKYLFLAVALVLCLVSCKNNKQILEETDTTSQEVVIYDFDEVISQDVEKYSDYLFYESQVTFDKNIMEDGAEPIYIFNVFQKDDTCMFVTHEIGGGIEIVKSRNFWCEDLVIELDSINIHLDDALAEMRALELIYDTKTMVLRRPLTKDFYKYPFYIFGTESTGFYSIDSKTGEIEKW